MSEGFLASSLFVARSLSLRLSLLTPKGSPFPEVGR